MTGTQNIFHTLNYGAEPEIELLSHPPVEVNKTIYLDIHLNPVFVHSDNPLHGWGVGKWQKKCLSEHLVDKVYIVPGAIQDVSYKVTSSLHVGLVVVHVWAVLADVG